MISRNCDCCQVEYMAEVRYLNRGQGIYCSKECADVGAGKKRRVVHEPNVSCSWCGVEFYRGLGHQKNSKSGLFFCSKDHQSAAFADPKHPLFPGPLAKPKSACPDCNGPYRGGRGRCRRCYKDSIITLWLSGDNSVTLNGGATKETKSFVKEHLIQTRGNQCEKCNFNNLAPDGRSIIQMNHIDGNCLNNNIDNLELLCPNCHAMTPNYGSLNKNSGRSHRRKSVISGTE